MKKHFLSALALFLIASSCVSPIPISQLSNEKEEGRWISGRKFLSQQEGNHILTLSYYKNEGEMLIFDMLYDNRSKEEIIFNPTMASIQALSADKKLLSHEKGLDPESKLLRIDIEESRERAYEANQAISNLILTATEASLDIAQINDPELSEEEKRLATAERDRFRFERRANMADQEAYLRSIRNSRVYWEEAPVRKTTVGSNEYISGKLFFPRNREAKYYLVDIDIPGKAKFKFEFEQEIIKP